MKLRSAEEIARENGLHTNLLAVFRAIRTAQREAIEACAGIVKQTPGEATDYRHRSRFYASQIRALLAEMKK